MKNHRSKFVTDIAISFVSPLMLNLSSFLVMVILTKFLSNAEYGIWVQFSATIGLITIFTCLNLGYSMSRFLSGDKDIKYISTLFSSIIYIIFFLSIISAGIIIISREPLSFFLFKDHRYAILIIIMALTIIFKNLNVEAGALLRARRYIKQLNMLDIIYYGLNIIFFVFAAIVTKNIFWVIAFFFLLQILFNAVYLIFIRKQGIRFKKPDIIQLIPLLRFGTPLLFTSMAYWIVQWSDRYFLGYFRDISSVGIYAVNYGIASLLLIFWLAVDNILFPDLSALFEEKRIKELELRFGYILKYLVAVSFASIAGLLILAKPIITVISTNEFVQEPMILGMLVFAQFFYGIFIVFSDLIAILKKIKIINFLWMIMAVMNLLLNIFLIPKYGLLGAAVSTLLSFLTGAIIIVSYSCRYFRIVFKISWILKTLIACLTMGLLVYFVPVYSVFSLLFGIFLGGVVFFAVLFILGFFERSELLLFKKSFFPIKK